jgi:hypothetical protein
MILRYVINTPHVIFETIDSESVAINLESGNYYNLNEIASEILALIVKNFSEDEIINILNSLYASNGLLIDQSVKQLIEELKKENLIRPIEKALIENNNPNNSIASEISADLKKKNFTQPILEKYSDMQNLFILDPIHDVDETGWPIQKTT